MVNAAEEGDSDQHLNGVLQGFARQAKLSGLIPAVPFNTGQHLLYTLKGPCCFSLFPLCVMLFHTGRCKSLDSSQEYSNSASCISGGKTAVPTAADACMGLSLSLGCFLWFALFCFLRVALVCFHHAVKMLVELQANNSVVLVRLQVLLWLFIYL